MSIVEDAMKAANIEYAVKGDKSEEKAEAPSDTLVANKGRIVAEKAKEIDEETKGKLAQYNSDRWLKEEKDDLKDSLADMLKIVETIEINCKKADPMNVLVALKMISEVANNMSKLAIPYANNQYVTGNFDTGVLGAKIGKYTLRAKWLYTRELQEQMLVIAAKQQVEQKSGQAIDDSPPVDVSKSKLFTVSLKK